MKLLKLFVLSSVLVLNSYAVDREILHVRLEPYALKTEVIPATKVDSNYNVDGGIVVDRINIGTIRTNNYSYFNTSFFGINYSNQHGIEFDPDRIVRWGDTNHNTHLLYPNSSNQVYIATTTNSDGSIDVQNPLTPGLGINITNDVISVIQSYVQSIVGNEIIKAIKIGVDVDSTNYVLVIQPTSIDTNAVIHYNPINPHDYDPSVVTNIEYSAVLGYDTSFGNTVTLYPDTAIYDITPELVEGRYSVDIDRSNLDLNINLVFSATIRIHLGTTAPVTYPTGKWKEIPKVSTSDNELVELSVLVFPDGTAEFNTIWQGVLR